MADGCTAARRRCIFFSGYFWCQISQDPQTGWFLLAQVETRLGLARGFRVEKCGKAAEAKRDLFSEQNPNYKRDTVLTLGDEDAIWVT